MATPDTAASEPEYVVLRLHEAGEGRWDRIAADTVKARSADGAVRAVVEKRTANDKAGTFVAVPARSWKPVTVKVETQTVLKLQQQ